MRYKTVAGSSWRSVETIICAFSGLQDKFCPQYSTVFVDRTVARKMASSLLFHFIPIL